jgi:hypothetical protein
MIKMTEDTIRENSQDKTKDRKQTAIEAVRIATLGRMAELGVIIWGTNPDKTSKYTIAKKN